VVGADVSEGADVSDAGTLRTIERLVNDAAKAHGGSTLSSPMRAFGRVRVDFRADRRRLGGNPPRQPDRPFLAIKHAGPLIKLRGGGSIVCTASVAGLRSGAGGAAYSASKAGVINLVQTAAQQLSGTGVRVNAICPGLIENGMTKPDLRHGPRQRPGAPHRRAQPLSRGGEPERSRKRRLFLASDDRATSTAPRWWSTADSRAATRPRARFDIRML
jgi:NAD(P)-dependent dehydrogenase (short-subunit alcohol dehydrogenase family)